MAWFCATAFAQLPSLSVQPWLGYNSVLVNKRFEFKVTSEGKMSLLPMNDKGQPLARTLVVPIEILVQEMMPDGKFSSKAIDVKTLASAQQATDKLEKTVITGKVYGDAAFEATIEHVRGAISIGGRVTDPGKLTKNPLRFCVRAKFPNPYPNAKIEDKKADDPKDKTKEEIMEEKRAERKAKREAEKEEAKKNAKNGKKPNESKNELDKIADDRIELKWTDGTRKRHGFDVEINAASKEVNGPGIAGAEIEIGAYQGRKFLFVASPDSAITLANDKPAPLFRGFSLSWAPDPAKDKDGKARLTFEAK